MSPEFLWHCRARELALVRLVHCDKGSGTVQSRVLNLVCSDRFSLFNYQLQLQSKQGNQSSTLVRAYTQASVVQYCQLEAGCSLYVQYC